MYYNKSNISNIRKYKEIKANSFHRDEMRGDQEVPEPVADGRPLDEASPVQDCGQKAFGSEISPRIQFEWITAQWAWRKQKTKEGSANRIAITLTFLTPQEIGTQQRPHKITFYLTDRHREFQATNPLQEQVLTLAGLRNQRWIGKARVRQSRTEKVQDHHRRNIPDLVMTAHIYEPTDGSLPYIQATLYTPDQQIILDFTEPLSLAQQKYYEGAARWGNLPVRQPARDDFYDWMRYA